jgi:methionine synthase II (cobalamin-independent)
MSKLGWTTTVVGSLPLNDNLENMNRGLKAQIDAGIEYPCYPQLVPMIDQFLDPIVALDVGLVKRKGRFYLESDHLELPKEPYALEYGQFMLDFFKNNPEYRNKIKGWKACLTGPFTLASEIIVPEEIVPKPKISLFKDTTAILSFDMVLRLAKMMSRIAAEYDKMGAEIISMDEPMLGIVVGRKTYYHTEEQALSIINQALSTINRNSSVHVCGRIAPKLRDLLLESNVKIMDHEMTSGHNRKLFDKGTLEQYNKTLAYGVLQTQLQWTPDSQPKTYIETKDQIKQSIQEAVDQCGKENLILKPDCGFAPLLSIFGEEMGMQIVEGKLKNLVQAKNEIA